MFRNRVLGQMVEIYIKKIAKEIACLYTVHIVHTVLYTVHCTVYSVQ